MPGGSTGASEVWGIVAWDDNPGGNWWAVEPGVLTAVPLPHGQVHNIERLSDSEFRILYPGRYLVDCSVSWQNTYPAPEADTGAMRLCGFNVNTYRYIAENTRPVYGATHETDTYGGRTVQNVSGWVNLNAGDVFKLEIYHTAVLPVNIDKKYYSPSIRIYRLPSNDDLLMDDDGTFVLDEYGSTMIDL
jgi:hypothetical protein